MMIGPNGAGKSNFISLFKFLNEIVEGRLQAFTRKSGGANSLMYFGTKTSPNIEVDINFGPNSYYLKLAATADDSLYFEEEYCTFQGMGYSRPYSEGLLNRNRAESGLTLETSRMHPVSKTALESITSWKLYHFHDTSESAPIKKSGPINDNDRFKPDASNLAAYLYLLQQKYPEDFSNITETVRMIAPFFHSFILRPSPLNTETIQLEWRHRNSENYFDASSLSDGTLRFICLTTLLLQPVLKLPKTILMDEPELGLHPAAIQLLASLLKSTSTRTQIIVSTQSVSLLNQMSPESIIVVDRDEEQSTFRRLTNEELEAWIEDYGLGDMWEKNIIGGRP